MIDDGAHPYSVELMLSLGASVIEDGRLAVDPVRVYAQALRGVVVFYDTIVGRDPSARHAAMDQLSALARTPVLEAEVQRLLVGCGTDGMGVEPYR